MALPAFKLSVIVPCHRPGPHLRMLLDSLVEQEFSQGFEVVLVDNAPGPGIRKWADGYPERLNLRIVEAKGKANGSYARNSGVAASHGEIVCFVDSDDEVAPGYLAAMVSALDLRDLVTSRVDTKKLNAEWVIQAHGPAWQDSGLSVFFGFLPSAGVNITLRRSLFDAIGGFNEAYSGSQDIEFCWRAQLQQGVTIQFVPDAVYRYRHRDSLLGLYRQTRNWGFSNVLLYSLFRGLGMPGRFMGESIREWTGIPGQLLKARTKGELGALMIRLGHCVGRLKGSIHYRTLYL
jgi:glycosyltransferase involved in cell wall biosynthesis